MENLTITSTKILPIENGKGGCVAIAQLVFNDALKLTGIKLIDNGSSRLISYQRNMSNKQKKSYFFPVSKDIADQINNRLWEDYSKLENN
jgi:DNA-binding cell septation regulator SpoVG